MGHFKQQELEYLDNGYRLPESNEKYVCSSHFHNHYLKKFIQENSSNGTCSYCGKQTSVIDLKCFMEFAVKHITDYCVPIENASLPTKNDWFDDEDETIPGINKIGNYAAPSEADHYEDAKELLEEIELVSDNADLDNDISSCFTQDDWVNKDPFSPMKSQSMRYSWEHFANLVKTKNRYTFFRAKEYLEIEEDDILGTISECVKCLEKTIDPGTIIFRGRPEDKEAPFTTFSSLTAPPAKFAKSNRMSPYGISMFYGSFDKDTVLKEIGNYLSEPKPRNIYIGHFKVKRPLKVIDLCHIPRPDFWAGIEEWQNLVFLDIFHNLISTPIKEKDPEIEYIPTQVFCEYLRFIQISKDGTHYDGIKYRSSLTRQENIVLFYDNKTSEEILTLEEVKFY